MSPDPAAAIVAERAGAAVATLGELRDRFDATIQVRPGTHAAYKQGLDSVCEHFGRDRALNTIAPLDADGWRRALVDEGLAPATVSKRVQTARNLFRKAVRWGMLAVSPFTDLKAGKQYNPERQRFIDRQTIDLVLTACPDSEWRLLVALSRYAGLRCPSEHLALTWGDVDWDRLALTVRAPKTNATRQVPIGPELLPLLQETFDRAEPGQAWVIARYRRPNSNLRTQLERIIGRAGLVPWPRLFHNLRASAASEWQECFPLASVARWLGHDPAVSARHYLTARDSDFDRATARGGAVAIPATGGVANPAAQGRPTSHKAAHKTPQTPSDSALVGDLENACKSLSGKGLGAGGFEPP